MNQRDITRAAILRDVRKVVQEHLFDHDMKRDAEMREHDKLHIRALENKVKHLSDTLAERDHTIDMVAQRNRDLTIEISAVKESNTVLEQTIAELRLELRTITDPKFPWPMQRPADPEGMTRAFSAKREANLRMRNVENNCLPWSDAESDAVKYYYEMGQSPADIAEVFGRTIGAINSHLSNLGCFNR